jgi:hypothetical protein
MHTIALDLHNTIAQNMHYVAMYMLLVAPDLRVVTLDMHKGVPTE